MTRPLGNAVAVGYSLTNGSFTSISDIKSVDSYSPTIPDVEMSAVSDTWAQHQPGFSDAGSWGMELYDTIANFTLIFTTLMSSSPVPIYYFQITDANASVSVTQSYIKSAKATYQRNTGIVWKLEFQNTGTPTLTAG